MKSTNLSLFLFVFNFFVGKGIAFLCPIFSALVIDVEIYNKLEFGLATGQILALIVTAGMPASILQFVLIRGKDIIDAVALLTFLIGMSFLCASVFLGFVFHDLRWSLLSLITCLSILQQSGAGFARAYGMRNASVWVDHFPTVLIMTSAALVSLVTSKSDEGQMYYIIFSISLIITCYVGFIAKSKYSRETLSKIGEAVNVGLPMVLSTIVGAWIASSGRVYASSLLPVDESYAYTFSFRVCSVMALLNAFIISGFTPRLYKLKTKIFDRFSAYMVSALALVALLMIVSQPYHLVTKLFPTPNSHYLSANQAQVFAIVQIFFWMSGAIVEMRVNRFRQAGRLARLNLLISTASAIAIFLTYQYNRLNLLQFVTLITLQQMLSCFAMHALLWNRGLFLKRTFFATATAAFILVSVAVITY